MSASYLLVSHSGDRVTRHASVTTAIARGAMLDRAVARSTGGRGGMDCHIVRQDGDVLTYRGQVLGRRLFGAGLGCGAGICDQARAAIAKAEGRA